MERGKRTVQFLPEEILTEILLRVPARSLATIKMTSKRWHALVSHPAFVKLHLQRSRATDSRKLLQIESIYPSANSMDPVCMDLENLQGGTPLQDPTTSLPTITTAYINGTCDGLICFSVTAERGYKNFLPTHEIFYLWNPSTCELRELPNLHDCSAVPSRWTNLTVGLGYDCDSDDYKVVAIVLPSDFPVLDKTVVHTWARKTGAWRRVPAIPLDHSGDGGYSHYSKGAVHWLANRTKGDWPKVILSFDFAKETFQEVSPVPRLSYPSIGTDLDGHLCVYGSSSLGFQAWVMKEYGVETSWAKFLDIQIEIESGIQRIVRPLYLRNGKILIILHDMNWTVFAYDVEEKRFHDLRAAVSWHHSRCSVYEESLVSPYCCVGRCSRL